MPAAHYPESYDDFGATQLNSCRKMYNLAICKFYTQKSDDLRAMAHKVAVLNAFDEVFPTP